MNIHFSPGHNTLSSRSRGKSPRIKILLLLALLLAATPLQAQTRATLLEPVSVPILQNGKPIGSAIARPGALVQILSRSDDSVEISTPLGPAQTTASNLLPVDDKPAPIPPDLSSETTPSSGVVGPRRQKTGSFSLPIPKGQSRLTNLDITDRSQTDPLLKIKTACHFLSDNVCQADEIKRHESPESQPPQYKRAFGRSDVIMIHPLDPTTPAEIDFSPITRNSTGHLKITVRDHPQRGDFTLQIEKGDFLIVDKLMDKDLWRSHTIPFCHEPVILKAFPNDWFDEFAYITYSISKE
jgi:hypothetical protein